MKYCKPLLALAILLSATGGYAESRHQQALADGVQSVLEQRLEQGIAQLKQLTKDEPQFQLAHLLHADLLRIKAGQQPGAAIEQSEYFSNAPLHLKQEFDVRLDRNKALNPRQYLPADIIHLDREYRHIMVADVERLRLYVYENRKNGLYFAEEYILSIGKNGAGKRLKDDLKTPLGVYFLNRYLPESDLPDLYGLGAFTMNYPNYWDKHNGRTGYGIWLHGTSFETYSRGPYSSRGCLTLTNDSFDQIKRYVDLGRTPILVGQPINWVSRAEWNKQNDFRKHFDRWLANRKQGDQQGLRAHYTHEFLNGEWSQHKARYRSRGQQVKVEQLSLLRHPQDNIVLATFSDASGRRRQHVRQYWQQQNGAWKIIYESEVRAPTAVAQTHKRQQRASSSSSSASSAAF